MIDELKEVNLGTIEEAHPTFISAQFSDDDENEYMQLQGMKLYLSRSFIFQMALDDEEKTTFQTLKGATYQRAMQGNFDDMLHKHVECYVDNLIVKSKKKCDHLKDLELVLDCLRKYQLRMHPLKYAFSMTSGKFMEFIVRHRGIEVENSKIDAIQKMSSSKNLHELRHYRVLWPTSKYLYLISWVGVNHSRD
ncbi:uncharacterized protein LOC127150672 [Cucumis melo]|uniref:Uncharacterized protein LOC127150672 n=1 Tax=Cucumis melo TaxID=3656 RepID=A0ABM3L544_CUCME|nr:uncharacterized protein LOC127150672 [Cucumis melo]